VAVLYQVLKSITLMQKVAVLTGRPGCGKSVTVRSVVELATAKNATVVLVAPTGRAARRLAELTGHEAPAASPPNSGCTWPATSRS
jgi:exodeoxyribonuclease V alpha subunit